MATTTPFNGTYYKLWKLISSTYVEIADGTSNSFESSRTVIDISNKTDGKWAKKMAGRISGTVSGSFLLNNESNRSAYVSWGDLWADYLQGTEFTLKMGTDVSGDSATTCTVFISSLNKTADDDGVVSFDATFEITGVIVSGS